jgi:hypothetical protein
VQAPQALFPSRNARFEIQRFLGHPDLLGLDRMLQVELIFDALVSILIARRLLDRPDIAAGKAIVKRNVWGDPKPAAVPA